MSVVVCACGRRLEANVPATTLQTMLHTSSHDPDECSRQVAFEGRFEGRREMVIVTMEHLNARRSLSGEELAEVRTVLLDLVNALPLGRIR